MAKNAWMVVCVLVVLLSWPGPAFPQSASPQSLAAAKELMIASKMADQINTLLPAIMQQLKPLVAKGSPQIERDFDTLMPAMMNVMNTHLDAFLDSGAQIYARHFTAEEMQQVTNFYRSTTGQKFLQKQPELVREGMALGQQFGQAIARDVQGRMVEELRKRGHPI
jgi:uncharacterized protein